jgi:hypothetical protein
MMKATAWRPIASAAQPSRRTGVSTAGRSPGFRSLACEAGEHALHLRRVEDDRLTIWQATKYCCASVSTSAARHSALAKLSPKTIAPWLASTAATVQFADGTGRANRSGRRRC